MQIEETVSYPVQARSEAKTSLSDRLDHLYDRAKAIEFPDFRMAGISRKPSELVGYLVTHGARSRRTMMPRRNLSIQCYTPEGRSAVVISFGPN